jgi:broad specificity phosphatase PhoE
MHPFRSCIAFFLFALSLWGVDCTTPQKLIIIRHGESDHNVNHVYNSNPAHPSYTPSHLTESGKETVKQTAKKLLKEGFNNKNITHVYVSPLPRTIETANLLAQMGLFSKDKIVIDRKLIEIQAGNLEGLPEGPPWNDQKAYKYHAETPSHVAHRVDLFYKKLKEENPCGNVIVVTHGIITIYLKKLLDITPPSILEPGEGEVFPLNH